MNIIETKISELIPAEYNPRTLTKKQFKDIEASLKEFGFVDPVIVNKHKGRENIIIGGHQRVKVWESMGNDTVPCNYTSLQKEKEQELNIRLNKNTGEFDFEILANQFDMQKLHEWGFEAHDFGIEVLEPEETEGDDDVPDVQEDPKTVKGDLYELGEHRLLCGDSTLIDDVEKLMNGEKADMVFTDPPYGIGIDGQKKTTNKNPKNKRKEHEFKYWDSERPSKDMFDLILSFSIPSIIFGGNYFADLLPPSRGWIYWNKGQDGLTMSDGELAWTNEDKPLRAVVANRSLIGKSVHPTQKPLQVIEFCLNYIEKSTAVLDLFLGSGSTLIACEKTKRKCYGMELDEKYCDVIVKRYIDFCKKNNKEYSVKRNGDDCKDFEDKE